VLAVHGRDAHAAPFPFPHDNLAGRYKHFLGGEGDVLARFDGAQDGAESSHADQRAEEDVGLHAGQFLDTFVAFVQNEAVGKPRAEGARGLAVGHGDVTDIEAHGVAEQRLGVASHGESHDFKPRSPRREEAEGRLPDGSRRAENDDFSIVAH
jgi:hypothetical protein